MARRVSTGTAAAKERLENMRAAEADRGPGDKPRGNTLGTPYFLHPGLYQ